MSKVWLLAVQTYRQYLRSGTFLILTFGLPLLMVIAGAIPILSMRRADLTQIGYVDQSGHLAVPAGQIEETAVTLTVYSGPEAARTALSQGDIDGYLVIPENYFQKEPPLFYGQEEPGPVLKEALAGLMRRAMLGDQPAWLPERLADPAQLTYVARSSRQEVAEGPGLVIQVATPLVLAILFGLTIFTGAGQMGAAMVREKENRAMEMVITSLAPWELVTGKVLGITLLTLTQIVIWGIGGVIAVGLALAATGAQSFTLPWAALLWATLLCGPGYFLYAVLAAGLGIIAGDQQQARQLSSVLGLVGLTPLYLLGALINNLDGPLALGLTWFPLTAPIVALFRMALSPVPAWQLSLSLVILLISLAAGVWFVARIFRAAMLLYGQSLRPKQIWQVLWQA
jgi:ABC-2 type transport system permease protein